VHAESELLIDESLETALSGHPVRLDDALSCVQLLMFV
jgi:hypothetical protein